MGDVNFLFSEHAKEIVFPIKKKEVGIQHDDLLCTDLCQAQL